MPEQKLLKRIQLRLMPETAPAERSLRGFGLWFARITYLFVLLGVLVFFFVGTPKYIQALGQGGASLSVQKDPQGQFLITQAMDEVAQAGIGPGDILVSVNDQQIGADTSARQLDQLLTGAIGETLTLGIVTTNGSSLEVTIVRGRTLLNALSSIGLNLSQLILFQVILTSSLMLVFALISFLIFIRRSDDWFVILVALTQMLLPLTLQVAPQLAYGASALNSFRLLNAIRVFSLFPLVAMVYLFPQGKIPSIWTGLIVALAGFLSAVNVANYFLNFFTPLLSILVGYLIWWLFILFGIVFQIYSYRRVYNRTERQQTKWVIVAFTTTLVIFFLYEQTRLIVGLSVAQVVLLSMARDALLGLALIFFAIIMAFAVFHYKLWDADIYINRTVIYGLVTGVLALFWGATMALLNYVFEQFADKQSPLLAAVLSSVQVIALFQPVRDRIEKWINSRFYADRVDFTQAIVELQPDRWQFITPQDMYVALAESVASLMQSDKVVVYTFNGKNPNLGSALGIDPAVAGQIDLDEATTKVLQAGKVVQLKDQTTFSLIVPLIVPRGKVNDLIGVLALGPRAEGRGYSRDHLSDLSDLGETAGTAIHFLQLNQKKLSQSA
jgi:hypothetical protein